MEVFGDGRSPSTCCTECTSLFWSFMAMVVLVWMDILANKLHPLDCFLSLGDNANAVAWLVKSNFNKEAEEGILKQRAKLAVAQKFAHLILSNDLVAWLQWLCGEDNIIPDICSRDWHLLDNDLINNLTLLFENSNIQNIPSFKIRPVPDEINSFFCSVLQNLPKNLQWFKTRKTSRFEPGVDGKNSFSQDIYSLTTKCDLCWLLPKPQTRHPQWSKERKHVRSHLGFPRLCIAGL